MSQHEPECEDHALVPRAGWVCICRQVRAAYQRGYDEGYDDGRKQWGQFRYEQVYRKGRNDQAASRAHAEAIYGPYKKPVPGNPSVVVDSSPHFIQHGKGENP